MTILPFPRLAQANVTERLTSSDLTYLESRDGKLFIINDQMGICRELATFTDKSSALVLFDHISAVRPRSSWADDDDSDIPF